MPTVVIDRGTCKYYADRAQHLDKITSEEERVIRLMPGKNFARFLSTHLLRPIPDINTRLPPVCLMPAHSIAYRGFRAVLKRIKKASDLQQLLSTLSQMNVDDDSLMSSLNAAVKVRQFAVINDLANLCGKPEYTDLQKMFLKVSSPYVIAFFRYCLLTECKFCRYSRGVNLAGDYAKAR
ncbi:unnamed protein product [Echinostoma caproni]|uniref:BTB domain-containing protein n=1 Tax=Echinostoma caproni TaxID=27848 RepID=A0A183A0N0_9TREM|nr:unnamed protein product [Echinostoma caproni]